VKTPAKTATRSSFRAYNDLLADFCCTDPARLKGIAMINLDDVPDGVIPPPFTIRCKVGWIAASRIWVSRA
jgi:hypothetical protein